MSAPEQEQYRPNRPPTPRHAHHRSGQDSPDRTGQPGGESAPGGRGWWGRLTADVVADAEAEGVTRPWALGIFWTPAVGGVLVAATFAVRPIYYGLLREDHLVEWLQFALCLLAALAAVVAAGRFGFRRKWLTSLTLLVMAFGCFALAGEEISWAQRVFGFASSGVANNRQGEFNLHNINEEEGIPVEELFRIFEMVLGLIGAVLPLFTRLRSVRLRSSYLRTFSPPLFVVPGFLAVFAYRFFRLLFPAEISAVVKYQEWAEVCLYGALAVMAVLLTVPARSVPGQPVASVPGQPVAVPDEPTTLRPSDLRVMLVAGVLVVILTIAFAVLSLMSGVRPGNI